MKILTTVLALLVLAAPAYAAEGTAGKVTYAKGDVSLFQTGRSAPTPLGKGDPVFAGDEIETGKNAAITVSFADDSTLTVGQNGKIIVDQYKIEGKSAKTVRLNTGTAAFEWLGAKNGTRDIEITTDSGTIVVGGAHVIRGTKGAETTVYVQDGSATVKTSGGKVDVAAGQGTIIAAKGSKPADAAPMNAEQIAWIRAELPAPATAWEAQGVAAAEVAPAPVMEQPAQPAAPMEVPPVSAAPTPVDVPAEVPVAAPNAAPVEAPVPTAPPVEVPVAAPVVPEANPQATVVTPTPAPAQIPMPTPVPPPAPEQAPAPLPVVPPLAP